MSKYHRLANHGIGDLEQMHQAAQGAIDEIKAERDLLRNCIRNAGLHRALYPGGDQ
jgi:hypothetical protein